MNIHEYQAKAVLKEFGVPVKKGYVAHSPIEAEYAMRRLTCKGASVAVVKAQVHAGGRGKAGGVKVVQNFEDCYRAADHMLGMKLVTKQTGEQGKIVRTLYVEEGSDIAKEYYLALTVNRETASIAVMMSTEGGIDIEEVAEKHPEKLVSIDIDPMVGVQPYHVRTLCFGLKLPGVEAKQVGKLLPKLFKAFTEKDMSMLEINPLIVTPDNEFVALDAKIAFDENALYRQEKVEEMRDFFEEESREIEASKYGLNFIGLDGNIACLVNGAGLAMATMDIIKHYGGEPANFLDVGGGATEEMVTEAFRIIMKDTRVKSIFVNIFGGIMKCDIIANGLVAATKKLGLNVPLVIRLEGTNVELGQKIIAESGLNLINATNMADGAQKACDAAK